MIEMDGRLEGMARVGMGFFSESGAIFSGTSIPAFWALDGIGSLFDPLTVHVGPLSGWYSPVQPGKFYRNPEIFVSLRAVFFPKWGPTHGLPNGMEFVSRLPRTPLPNGGPTGNSK